MFSTFDVSKLDKSSAPKDSQPLNMELILVTDDVSNEDKSTAWSKVQPENMDDISVTPEVSSPERPIDSATERPENSPEADPFTVTPGSMRTELISEEKEDHGASPHP